MDKYNEIFEALQEKVNNGSISSEFAESVNDLAYEKYIVEAVKVDALLSKLKKKKKVPNGKVSESEVFHRHPEAKNNKKEWDNEIKDIHSKIKTLINKYKNETLDYEGKVTFGECVKNGENIPYSYEYYRVFQGRAYSICSYPCLYQYDVPFEEGSVECNEFNNILKKFTNDIGEIIGKKAEVLKAKIDNKGRYCAMVFLIYKNTLLYKSKEDNNN